MLSEYQELYIINSVSPDMYLVFFDKLKHGGQRRQILERRLQTENSCKMRTIKSKSFSKFTLYVSQNL